MKEETMDELDQMINDLNCANDEFISSYFEEDTEENEVDDANIKDTNKEEYVAVEEIKEEKSTDKFSYNNILNRLDKKMNLNKVDDIIELIENSNNSEEFFDVLEKEYPYDK